MDLSKLSTVQLEAILRAAQKEKKRKLKRKSIAQVRQMLNKAAASSGYTLAEIFVEASGPSARRATKASKGGKVASRKGAGGKVAPKYRNPSDATQVWTGRGRQPKWVVEALANGESLEGLLIGAKQAE